MDDQRIHEKLDKIIDDVTEMKITQIKQQAVLEHHVYRCDLLEVGQDTLREETAKAFSDIREELKPVISFKDRIVGAAKLGGIILTIIGIIVGALKISLH